MVGSAMALRQRWVQWLQRGGGGKLGSMAAWGQHSVGGGGSVAMLAALGGGGGGSGGGIASTSVLVRHCKSSTCVLVHQNKHQCIGTL